MTRTVEEEKGRLARGLRLRLETLSRLGLTHIRVAPATRARFETRSHVPPAGNRPREAPSPVAAVVVAPVVAPIAHQPSPSPASHASQLPPPAPKPALVPAVSGAKPSLLLAGSLFPSASAGFDTAVVPAEERPGVLQVLQETVSQCVRCPDLVASRTQTVFGVGNPLATLMFVGEAPGEDEDREGIPFIGRAGQLLTDMITKGMGLTRDQVYIANSCKCRPTEPPGKNRQPTLTEIQNCRGYLEEEIRIVRPKFLCLLGKSAAMSLLETMAPMSVLRKRWHKYKNIPTIVTYHPSYLLRTAEAKKEAWEDLKMLMQAMGIKPPSGGARKSES